MKRTVAILLLAAMLLGGCGDRIREPVTFYYIRGEYEIDMSEMIATEQREASGHREDLSYLLALYFMGPAAEELRSPFPENIALTDICWDKDHVTLTLSDTVKTMTDAQYTLACGCLSLTAMEISGAKAVTVTSGERTVTMSAASLTLQDQNTQTNTEETG